jgi:hypothetical protein
VALGQELEELSLLPPPPHPVEQCGIVWADRKIKRSVRMDGDKYGTQYGIQYGEQYEEQYKSGMECSMRRKK